MMTCTKKYCFYYNFLVSKFSMYCYTLHGKANVRKKPIFLVFHTDIKFQVVSKIAIQCNTLKL